MDRGGQRPAESRIVGYVYNDSPQDAVNIQLRISELDGLGPRSEAVIKPMGDPVPALSRAFFDLQSFGHEPDLPGGRRVLRPHGRSLGDERTEQLLAAAGFQMKLADTPERSPTWVL